MKAEAYASHRRPAPVLRSVLLVVSIPCLFRILYHPATVCCWTAGGLSRGPWPCPLSVVRYVQVARNGLRALGLRVCSRLHRVVDWPGGVGRLHRAASLPALAIAHRLGGCRRSVWIRAGSLHRKSPVEGAAGISGP